MSRRTAKERAHAEYVDPGRFGSRFLLFEIGLALFLNVWCGCDGDAIDESTDSATSMADAASPPAPREALLVDHERWVPVGAEDDPFAAHRPDGVDCGIAGYYVELDQLELDTSRCNYAALEQPALHAVGEHDELGLELTHYDLTAPEPAQAHVALWFGATPQWETTIEIPHAAQVLPVVVPVNRSLAPGETIGFHLHNHGQNTWLLGRVFVRRK